MEDTMQSVDARQCLEAARTRMRQVKRLLSKPSAEAADESAALLRDVEVQLGCVAAILRQETSRPDVEIRTGVEDLQNEVAMLATFFSEADKLFTGWIHAVRTRQGGYTDRGQAAPLVLLKKLSVEG
jgi:hypothetical protein